MSKSKGYFLLFVALLILISALFIGSGNFSITSLFDSTEGNFILLELRLPRMIFTLLVGIGLSVSGLVFQTIFRNSLATPYTLGLSSGAAFGAILAIILFKNFTALGSYSTSIFAFLGAILVLLGIKFILKFVRKFDTKTILLAGVALNFFFGALILFLQYFADPTEVFLAIRWLMGNLTVVGYTKPLLLFAIVLPTTLIFFFKSNEMNALLIGDELAQSRGVDVAKLQNLLIVTASVLVSGIVALAGPIGFVGLVVPHIAKKVFGENLSKVLPVSILIGGIFLIACDSIAKIAIPKSELPVGVITAILGGPFFIWVLLHKNEQ
ncbi:MAG: iron ABC transporter permease [Calditrichaeota bacterium]|nr:MAG: iron ABC transporter permease [Calditrichota bacterium]